MEQAYARVKENIERALLRAGRPQGSVALIAVTKGRALEDVRRLIALGQMDFGENRAQALAQRMQQCEENVRWHCIGQLQTNKVKYIISHVRLVQSLDRLGLAREMDAQARKRGVVASALVQVRFDGPSHRGGIAPQEGAALLDGCAQLQNLSIEGLMCMAPLDADERSTRECFEALKRKHDDLSRERWPNVRMETLSMGMSRDYQWAIEHGATMVRVGSALFPTGL
jgi:pyridoxal phosphate enzyme (YggS family)